MMDCDLPSELRIDYSYDGSHPSATVLIPMEYKLERLSCGEHIIIQAGFRTDFASVPRVLHCLFPPTKYPYASVLHDYLYAHNNDYTPAITRKEADGCFYDVLRKQGASWLYANIMWAAVRFTPQGRNAWK